MTVAPTLPTFEPLRHPDGEIKKGYRDYLAHLVTIIYLSLRGKSSLRPFRDQRRNLVLIFAPGIDAATVCGLATTPLSLEASNDLRMMTRVFFIEYDIATLPKDTLSAAQLIADAKRNGTWVEDDSKTPTCCHINDDGQKCGEDATKTIVANSGPDGYSYACDAHAAYMTGPGETAHDVKLDA